MVDNVHVGHRKRLRDSYRKTYFDGMQYHQVLELILFYAIPKRDTNPIAHRLLNKFGSLADVFDAPIEELVKVNGVGYHVAHFLKEIRQMINYYENYEPPDNKMNGFLKWSELILNNLNTSDKEALYIVGVNGKLNVLGVKQVPYDILLDTNKLYTSVIDVLNLWRCYRFGIVEIAPYKYPLFTSKRKFYIEDLKEKLNQVEIELLDYFLCGNDNRIIAASYVI